MFKSKTNILGSLFSVTGIIVLTKFIGFIKQMITANAFGTSIETDLLALSQGIVIDLEFVIIQTFITAFIPIYLKLGEKNNNEQKKFISNSFWILILVTLIIVCVLIINAPIISKIIAPKYNNELSLKLAKYISLFAPVLIIIIIIAVFNALLRANEIFFPGEITSLIQSSTIIICVIFFREKLGITTLVISFFVYYFINLVYMGINAKKFIYIKPEKIFQDKNIIIFFKMIGPLLFAYGMVIINQQIDRIILSTFDEGIITSLSYAAVLSNFVTTFICSICTVLFTYISKKVVEHDVQGASRLVNYFSILLVTVFIPITMITILNAKMIVTIVFGRGAFNNKSITYTTYSLIGYSIGFIPLIFRELLTRYQYAYQDSKHPMINSSISILFNIIGSIILSKIWGIFGVTLASSISVSLCALFNLISSKKYNYQIEKNISIKHFTFWTIGVLFCIASKLVISKYLNIDSLLLSFLIEMSVSLLGYLLIASPILIHLIKNDYFINL